MRPASRSGSGRRCSAAAAARPSTCSPALPLGGYVRMASRHDAETAFLEGGSEEQTARAASDPGYDPNAMIPFGPKPVPEDRWFESKPLWARIVIMIAGVVMNVLLAVVVATLLAYHYGQLVYPGTVIGAARAPAGAPELAQLQSGDSIRTINGVAVRTWNDVRKGITSSTGAVAIATQRGEVRIPLGRDKGSADDIADGLDLLSGPGHRHGVSGRPRGTGWVPARRFHRQRRRPCRCARGATWSSRLASRLTSRSRSSSVADRPPTRSS